jgi:cytoskeletal protein RodZ
MSDYAMQCPQCGYEITVHLNGNNEEVNGVDCYANNPQTERDNLPSNQNHKTGANDIEIRNPKKKHKPKLNHKQIAWLIAIAVIPLFAFIAMNAAFFFEDNTRTNARSSSTVAAYSSSYGSSASSDSSNSYSSSSSLEKDTYAQLHAEAFVKKYLKSPSTAKFPNYNEYSYDFNGNKWTVKGYVDAQNSYGATLRQEFTVSFTILPSNWDNATLDTIDIY